jgi:hypothetical protein
MFVAGGFAMIAATWRRDAQPRQQPILGATILIGLTLVCHWVAFGDGERRFTRTTSVNDVVIHSRPVDEHTGRFVFGFAAIILDVVLVALLVKHLRRRPDAQ